MLAEKDLTMVGEKGVCLSGGQRSRVCLSRAVYHDAQVILMDCPFASIDPIVALKIFQR